jgi:hypothetical protein
MLKAMRKNLKSLKPVLWIVVGTFILAIFAIWGGGQFGGAASNDYLAKVGGEKITADEYYQNLRQRLEGMQREFKDLSGDLIQQLNIPQQILEQLIQQRLLLQNAREMGLRATTGEVRDRIMSPRRRPGTPSVRMEIPRRSNTSSRTKARSNSPRRRRKTKSRRLSKGKRTSTGSRKRGSRIPSSSSMRTSRAKSRSTIRRSRNTTTTISLSSRSRKKSGSAGSSFR